MPGVEDESAANRKRTPNAVPFPTPPGFDKRASSP